MTLGGLTDFSKSPILNGIKRTGRNVKNIAKTGAVTAALVAPVAVLHTPVTKADSYSTVTGVVQSEDPMTVSEAFAYAAEKLDGIVSSNNVSFKARLNDLASRDVAWPEIIVKDLEKAYKLGVIDKDELSFLVNQGDLKSVIDLMSDIKKQSRVIMDRNNGIRPKDFSDQLRVYSQGKIKLMPGYLDGSLLTKTN